MRLILFAAALALAGPGVRAQAADPPSATSLSAEDLADQRAGFTTPDGVELGFGAVVRTFVDGELALQTRLTWTSEGAVRTVEAGRLTAGLAERAAMSGLSLRGHVDGVLIEGEGGATAILHELSSNRLVDVVVNSANNRDIRQAADVTLTIPDFARLQADMSGQRGGLRLQDAVGAALRDATLR